MKTLFALALAGACGAACAQTPATNPMPDGSRDRYVGLGVIAAPDYAGASERRTEALPMIQAEWSNGLFISGMSAGWHVSQRPDFEFGPLLVLDPGRDEDGTGSTAGGVTSAFGLQTGRMTVTAHGLAGMRAIGARLQTGIFANYYLAPALRLTSSVLYGAGHERNGVVWSVGLQRVATDLAAHHRVSLSAGLNLVNRNYNASFFGVTTQESLLSGHTAYAPGGGLRDVYLGAGWNWALSPGWMIASAARLARLQGDARHSPLVERPTNFTVSTGLVYRF